MDIMLNLTTTLPLNLLVLNNSTQANTASLKRFHLSSFHNHSKSFSKHVIWTMEEAKEGKRREKNRWSRKHVYRMSCWMTKLMTRVKREYIQQHNNNNMMRMRRRKKKKTLTHKIKYTHSTVVIKNINCLFLHLSIELCYRIILEGRPTKQPTIDYFDHLTIGNCNHSRK